MKNKCYLPAACVCVNVCSSDKKPFDDFNSLSSQLKIKIIKRKNPFPSFPVLLEPFWSLEDQSNSEKFQKIKIKSVY